VKLLVAQGDRGVDARGAEGRHRARQRGPVVGSESSPD